MLVGKIEYAENSVEMVCQLVPFPTPSFLFYRLVSSTPAMKKMGRDIKVRKRPVQAKSLPISNESAPACLENRVANYLTHKKGDKSLGVFAAELGIPKPSLKRYLDSAQSMSLSTLAKIAAALGVSPSSILK
jgi:DNA-binding Xre family transcriptional regulator